MVARSTALAVVAVGALAGCVPGPPTLSHTPSPSPPAPVLPTLDVEVGLSDPVRDPLYPDYGNVSVDVLAYWLDLAWDPVSEKLTGTATLELRAVTSISEITLDFARAYTVDSVTVDGTEVDADWDGDDLTTPHALGADERATVVVRYRGAPETVPMPSERGDFAEGLGLRVSADGDVWTMQEPYGASTWYPANDMPSDEAVYEIRVTVPEELSAVASGTFLGAFPADPGTVP